MPQPQELTKEKLILIIDLAIYGLAKRSARSELGQVYDIDSHRLEKLRDGYKFWLHLVGIKLARSHFEVVIFKTI
jgi:hypothetical protein